MADANGVAGSQGLMMRLEEVDASRPCSSIAAGGEGSGIDIALKAAAPVVCFVADVIALEEDKAALLMRCGSEEGSIHEAVDGEAVAAAAAACARDCDALDSDAAAQSVDSIRAHDLRFHQVPQGDEREERRGTRPPSESHLRLAEWAAPLHCEQRRSQW